jgi:hypothetical protein
MPALEPEIGHVPAAVGIERRKPLMVRVVDPVATGLGNAVGWLAESGALFAVFAVIWIAVAVGLVWSAGTVDDAWRAIRALPIVVQLIAWVLFLPVMVGMWIWESSWPFLVRLVLVIGVAGWNLLIFLPKAARTAS